MSDKSHLEQLIYDLLAEHEEDRKQVVSLLMERLPNDEALADVMDDILYAGIKERVDYYARQRRDRLFDTGELPLEPGESGESHPNAVDASVNGAILANSLLDYYRLSQSKVRLGDATEAELAEDIEMYQQRIVGSARRKRFLEAIADRLEPNATVRECWTEEEVQDIRAEHGVAV